MCSQYCQLAKWSHRFFSPFGELTSRGGALAGRALTDSKFWHPNRNYLSKFQRFQFMMHFQLFTLHVTGFSDLVDLWVIKIKSPWSFAHVVRRDHVNRTTRREHTKGLFRSQKKIVWLSNMADIFFRNSRGAQRHVGFFPLIVLIGWAGKLRSHDETQSDFLPLSLALTSSSTLASKEREMHNWK